jgi:hypothetical protein
MAYSHNCIDRFVSFLLLPNVLYLVSSVCFKASLLLIGRGRSPLQAPVNVGMPLTYLGDTHLRKSFANLRPTRSHSDFGLLETLDYWKHWITGNTGLLETLDLLGTIAAAEEGHRAGPIAPPYVRSHCLDGWYMRPGHRLQSYTSTAFEH